TLWPGAAKKASRTVPIVFLGVFDPVAAGLVDNLARPTGKITGFSNMISDLSATAGVAQGKCSQAVADCRYVGAAHCKLRAAMERVRIGREETRIANSFHANSRTEPIRKRIQGSSRSA